MNNHITETDMAGFFTDEEWNEMLAPLADAFVDYIAADAAAQESLDRLTKREDALGRV